MAEKRTFGSFESLKSLTRGQVAKFNPEALALHQQALDLYAKGLRSVVDGVVGLSPAERKAYVQPYVDFGTVLQKTMKTNQHVYYPPPRWQLWRVAANFPVFVGWLQNRHKYKEGELLPPVTVDDLRALEQTLIEKSGIEDFILPSAFCDSYLICGGMHPHVRTDPMGGLTILTPAEIPAMYDDMILRFKNAQKMTPLSEDGAGNLYAVDTSNDVFDFNHEDGLGVRMVPFPKLIAKAHKVTR